MLVPAPPLGGSWVFPCYNPPPPEASQPWRNCLGSLAAGVEGVAPAEGGQATPFWGGWQIQLGWWPMEKPSPGR